MVASSSPAHLALHVGQAMEGAVREALHLSRPTMRSAAQASLLPFFLFFLGHCFSLTLALVDYHLGRLGGRFLWVASDEIADGFVTSVMAIAAVSFLLLCLSVVATLSASSAINSGRRLTLRESFSKAAGLWGEPSTARHYFAILFLGYVLSFVALVVVSLVTTGDYLRLSTWHFLVSLLVLSSFLYSGVLRSVGLGGSFVLPAGEGGRGVVQAPSWTTALVLMEEEKLQGFFLFFLSLVIIHGVLLLGNLWADGFHEVPSAIRPSPWMPVLMDISWMLGSCGFFGYVGILLQV